MNKLSSNYFLKHTEDIYNSDIEVNEEDNEYSITGSDKANDNNKDNINPFSNMMSNINSTNNSKGFAHKVVNDIFSTDNELNDSKNKSSYEYKESPAFSKYNMMKYIFIIFYNR